MADRETIMTWLKKCGNGGCSSRCPYDDLGPDKCYETLMTDALELLREQPEQKFFVDFDGKITPLPKQRHGNWVPIKSPTGVEYGGFKEYTVQEVMCSKCGFTDDVSASIYTYCPECGARMDEEVKQDG